MGVVGVGDRLLVGVGVGESVGVAFGDGEEESVTEGAGVGESDTVGVGVALAVSVGDALGLTEGDAVASAVGELLCDGDGVGVDVVSPNAIEPCEITETARRTVANERFQSRRMKPPVAPRPAPLPDVAHCVGFATDSPRTRRPDYGSRIVVPLRN